MAHLWFAQALLPDGWAADVRITVADGRITTVQPGTPPTPDDDRHGTALPGLPNLHSHAFQRGMAGLAETSGTGPDDFWTWRDVMYRFLDRMQPEDVEAVAAQAYAEMLESGFTRVGEFHYLHHAPDGMPYANPAELAARIAAAAETAGIGLTLLPVIYQYGGFGHQPPGPGQRRFVTTPDGFARLLDASRHAIAGLDGAICGIAPHSLRAVPAEQLAALLPLAQGGPVHIHVAEQTKEVDDCLAATGSRPIDLLLDHAPVDASWCLIHATHADPAELRRLAATRAVAGLCPITEANLGDGIFPARDFLDAGGTFGIGTDSNVLIDAAQELRQMEYAARLSARARNVLAVQNSTGATLFSAAIAGGAQALGQTLSGLATGASADIVSLNPEHPVLLGRAGDQLLDGWIFAARDTAIDCVWRHGVKQVAGGQHLARRAITARYKTAIRRLTA